MTFQIQKPSPVRFGDVMPWNLEGASKPTPKPPASPRFGDIDWTEFYGQRVGRLFNGHHQPNPPQGDYTGVYEIESSVPSPSTPTRLGQFFSVVRGLLAKSFH